MSTDDNVHSKACMASAMIQAVENFRDADGATTESLQQASIGEEAGMYLLSMPDLCKCHVYPIAHVKDTYKLHNSQYAKRSAERWLYADRITLMDFTKLMGWIDRAERAEWTGETVSDPELSDLLTGDPWTPVKLDKRAHDADYCPDPEICTRDDHR